MLLLNDHLRGQGCVDNWKVETKTQVPGQTIEACTYVASVTAFCA